MDFLRSIRINRQFARVTVRHHGQRSHNEILGYYNGTQKRGALFIERRTFAPRFNLTAFPKAPKGIQASGIKG